MAQISVPCLVFKGVLLCVSGSSWSSHPVKPCVCVCVCVWDGVCLRWDGGGGQVSLCQRGWECSQWQQSWGQMRCQSVGCRCDILWVFGALRWNTADASLTVMHTRTHKYEHTFKEKTDASGCDTHYYPERHWNQHNDQWLQINSETNLQSLFSSYNNSLMCLRAALSEFSLLSFYGSSGNLHFLWHKSPD